MGDTPWVVGARFEYDSLLLSKNDTRLGAADSYKEVSISQNSGRGYNLYLSFRNFLNTDGSGIVIESFYKYWEASGSDS